jgi:protein-disulfide isomerase
MDNDRKLTKREKKELRKMELQEKARKEEQIAKIKKYSIWIGSLLAIVLIILGLIWLVNTPSNTTLSLFAPAINSSDITQGDKNAKVTLIEYADFQCPACATYHPIINRLLSDEKGNIYYAYRMFPLTNIHPNSHISAQAAYSAYKQGEFFEYSDLLFNNQKDWANVTDPRSIFIGYAKELNLDLKKFQTDMNSSEAKDYVNKSEQAALSLGINATPTFFVNGKQIQNPQNYAEFKKIIDNGINQK